MLEARGRLPGPIKIRVHYPKLAGPFGAHFQAGQYALRARAQDRRLRHHRPLAHAYPTAHELPNAKVEAILNGLPTTFDDRREQIVYEMAIILSNGRWARL